MRSVAALLLLGAVAMPLEAGAAEFRTPTEEAVILYDAPSAQSQKLFIVNQGYPLEVVVALQGWVKVRDAAGALSWVEAGKVTAKPRFVMVKAPVVPIRGAADEGAPVLFQAQQNVLLELLDTSGAWLRVRHKDGAIGYVRAASMWGA